MSSSTIGGLMMRRKEASQSATFVVAASDSLHPERADYVCDGVDDQVEIQAAIGDGGNHVVALPGNYVINGYQLETIWNSWYVGITLKENTILDLAGAVFTIPNGINKSFVFFWGHGEDNITIKGVKIFGNRANQTSGDIGGIHLYQCENASVLYNEIYGHQGHGIAIDVMSYYAKVIGNYVRDSYTYANGITLHNTAISHAVVANNRVKNISGGNGIYLDTMSCAVVANNIIESCPKGVFCYDSGDLNNVVSNNICNCDIGVDIDATSNKNNIKNNILSGNTTHINIEGDNNDIISNYIDGGTTPLTNTGSNNIIRNNRGFITENSGTATIANGSTSIVVDHGLDVTPSAGDIMVTPTGSLGSASYFYIDTFTSTQFTIHVDANPGANVDFAWKAIVL